MKAMKVRCNYCDWVGWEHDLVIAKEGTPDDYEYFNACPNCKTDEYLMDLGEEELE